MPENNARKVKLGQRWVCYECDARFYDLNRPEPLCPKCKADQRKSPVFEKPKRRRGKKAAREAPSPPVEVVEEPVVAADEVDAVDSEFDREPGLDDEDAALEDELEHG